MTSEERNWEEITRAEAVRRLTSLTEQQRTVLELRCQGMSQKQIAHQLDIVVSTVKSHMGAVYLKLALKEIAQGQRDKALFETFCPALREENLPPPPPEPDEPELVPDEVQAMVDVDELAFDPQPTVAIDSQQSSSVSRPRRPGWMWWVIGIVLGIIFILAFIILRPILSGESDEAGEVTEETSPAVVEDAVLTLTAAVQQVADLEGTGTALALANNASEAQAIAPEAAASTPLPSAIATESLPTPTITPLPLPTDTPPGSVLDLQRIWREEGVELVVLDDHQFDIEAKQLYVNFKFKNDTGKDLLVQYGIDNISAVDDLGNRMPILGIWRVRSILVTDYYNDVEMLLEPRQEIKNMNVDRALRIELDTGIMCDISEITIIFTNISRIDEAKWRIPVDIC